MKILKVIIWSGFEYILLAVLLVWAFDVQSREPVDSTPVWEFDVQPRSNPVWWGYIIALYITAAFNAVKFNFAGALIVVLSFFVPIAVLVFPSLRGPFFIVNSIVSLGVSIFGFTMGLLVWFAYRIYRDDTSRN